MEILINKFYVTDNKSFNRTSVQVLRDSIFLTDDLPDTMVPLEVNRKFVQFAYGVMLFARGVIRIGAAGRFGIDDDTVEH